MTLDPAKVAAALNARKEAQAAGPRSLSDLARACGVSLSSLHQALGGKRAMPAATEAAIRASLPEMHD